MCGIFCCLSKKIPHYCLNSRLENALQNRGPNSQRIIQFDNTLFAGFVLWHQGLRICSQPLESDNYILLFNGDVFNMEEKLDISDTECIFEKLAQSATEDELINCFRLTEGPFSFIFYDKRRQCLYFARDSLGRNSLLLEVTQDHVCLLSVSHIQDENVKIVELPPLGVYKIYMKALDKCHVFPWQKPDDWWNNQAKVLEDISKLTVITEQPIEPGWLGEPHNLDEFSYNFYDMTSDKQLSTIELYESLLKNVHVSQALNTFSNYIENSVKQRVNFTTDFCAKCLPDLLPCHHSKIGILFSGGIDCTILSALAHKYVPISDTIDLINVSFQAINSGDISWNVPDRISAKSSLANLKKLCPDRKWNFIEVNVTRNELYNKMEQHIKHLIYPLNTVLDESIGCAFWFASQTVSSARVILVGSGADELFGGYVRHKNAYNRCIGTNFEKERSLHNELEMDWKRIPARNLARDDRVISDNGKTPRAPFIEENVVKFVRSLRPNQRCCFLYEDGIGDKLFLRLFGYRLGLKGAAFLKKRAIQFGSKIANKKQNAKDRSAFM